MSAKPDKNGKWSVQVDRKGIPRVRRGGFASKEAAEQFEREYLAQHRVRCKQHRDMPTYKHSNGRLVDNGILAFRGAADCTGLLFSNGLMSQTL